MRQSEREPKGEAVDHEEFVEEVRWRAGLGSRGEAEDALRATFETLAERLAGGEVEDLASQLPQSLAKYLRHERAGYGEPYTLNQFLDRVGEREGVDTTEAASHVRAIFSLVQEVVTPGEMSDVRAQLPGDFAPLFKSQGEPL